MVYGLPTREVAEAAERYEVVLGGCVLTDDDPPRCCTRCRAALWPSGVFAIPGAGDDTRIVLVGDRTERRLEALVGRDGAVTIAWSDRRGPSEDPAHVGGEDVDLLALVLAADLFGDGPSVGAWLQRRGLGHVGEVPGRVDRVAFTSDGMVVLAGPGGDLLIHASVARFTLHLIRALYRRHGYRSVVELREWLASVGLDIVRSG